MDSLAYDLVLYLHEPGTCAVLVRILERVPGQSPPGYDNGILRCNVDEVIHGQAAGSTHSISVPYSRMVDPLLRAKSSINHWNTLPLSDGNLLLLVCKPAAEVGTWEALSGNQVTSNNDSVVVGLKECYRIQDLSKASEEHKAALEAGLVSTNPLPRRYALEAICKHEDVPRDDGCELIVKALTKADLDREILLRFADSLSSIPLFDEEQGADTVNQQVVTSLASIIERLTKPPDRVTCVRYLASCILADFDSDKTVDRKQRAALLLAIGKSPPPPIADTLTSMAGSDIPDDRQIAEELSDAWKASE